MRRLTVFLSSLTLLCACASKQAATSPPPAPVPSAGERAEAPPPVRVDTVILKDPELQRRVERLELNLLEKEAQIDELQATLDDTRQEVVRAMARLQTLATRAEAASGLAEAEVALQSLGPSGGQQVAPEAVQAKRLLDLGTAEFNKQNYGGALYLANQTKTVAAGAKGRLASGEWATLRSGEVLFAVPLRLQTTGRANVREGPGANFRTLATLEAGTPVKGYSYADQWVHVRDESGTGGWISYSLLGRRQGNRR